LTENTGETKNTLAYSAATLTTTVGVL